MKHLITLTHFSSMTLSFFILQQFQEGKPDKFSKVSTPLLSHELWSCDMFKTGQNVSMVCSSVSVYPNRQKYQQGNTLHQSDSEKETSLAVK